MKGQHYTGFSPESTVAFNRIIYNRPCAEYRKMIFNKLGYECAICFFCKKASITLNKIQNTTSPTPARQVMVHPP